MSVGEIVLNIIVAIIGLAGTSMGSIFAYIQYQQKRKDEKEVKTVQSQINESLVAAKKELREEIIASCGEIGDKAIENVRKELMKELEEGLEMRGEEGRKRFEINSKAIEENTAQINKLTELVEDQIKKLDAFTDSMTSLNKVVKVSAESQRNFNYDRILHVANNALRTRHLTITDKTNLTQLYESWTRLNGDDPKIKTLYEEVMKIPPVPDED
jgi:hypothetical protein